MDSATTNAAAAAAIYIPAPLTPARELNRKVDVLDLGQPGELFVCACGKSPRLARVAGPRVKNARRKHPEHSADMQRIFVPPDSRRRRLSQMVCLSCISSPVFGIFAIEMQEFYAATRNHIRFTSQHTATLRASLSVTLHESQAPLSDK